MGHSFAAVKSSLFATAGGKSAEIRRKLDASSQAEVEAMIVHASAAEYRAFMVRAMLGAAHDFEQGDALDSLD